MDAGDAEGVDWGRNRFPDSAEITERLQNIDRRKLLVGLGGLAAWQIVPIPSGVDEKLSDAEARLLTLSETIYSQDLRDPSGAEANFQEIEQALDFVEAILQSDAVGDGRTVADYLQEISTSVASVRGTAAPRAYSKTRRRMATLEAAVRYYSGLQTVFLEASDVQRLLSVYEIESIYTDGSFEIDLVSEVSTTALTDAISSVPELGDLNHNAVARRSLVRFLPDTKAVRAQLQGLPGVYETFRTALTAFLESNARIEAGARHHERARFGKAESEFGRAREASRIEFPANDGEYSLGYGRLSLKEYAKVFEIRCTGIDRLKVSCDASRSATHRRNAFNNGLDRLFDARRIVRHAG